MAEERKARAVGFNHVALEVGDIEEALAFYGRLFEFKLALVDISGAKALAATAVSEVRKEPGLRRRTWVRCFQIDLHC